MHQMAVLHRGSNNSIPYLAHNLFSEKIPLVRVKVGPLVEDTDQIQALLQQYGYDVPVSKSAIPLRTAAAIKP